MPHASVWPLLVWSEKKMNDISLLPTSIKLSQKRFYIYRISIIVTISLIIIGIVSFAVMFIYTKVINNKLKQLISQRVATDAYVESKNNVLVTQYEIDSLVKIVDKVMGNVPEWSELLTEIDKCTTKDIKNHIVKGNYGGNVSQFKINGYTVSQQSLKIYMDEIGKIASVNEVKLSFIRQHDIENADQFEFEIVVYLKLDNHDKEDTHNKEEGYEINN
jgi:hypothetical protein